MATTIREQVKDYYVGEIVDLFKIDTTPIGGAVVLYLSPSSGTAFEFDGNEYLPFPIAVSNVTNSINEAPGRVTMNVAAPVGSAILQIINMYGDLVGAEVTYIRTFSNFLDAGSNPNPTQTFPIQRYVVLQKSSFSRDGVAFILGTRLDRPGLQLPRRQILRDNVGNRSLWCPGVSRIR